MSLPFAKLNWQTDHQGNSVPVSCDFDDVYFSKDNGLLESEYVFLTQNRLSERFDTLFKTNQPNTRFVIAETGFGTGLNFLATCALWLKVAQKYDLKPHKAPALHFISTEKYPLAPTDLAKSLAVWQGTPISPFIECLLDEYPLPIKGCHRKIIAEKLGVNIVLDLWLGEATDSLSQLALQPTTQQKQTKIDAWFLDGFAPSKNDTLWSDTLFDTIKVLSKPTTTLTTFTAAGSVKRQLLRIGATPLKVKGFGHKREMLTAHFNPTQTIATPNPKPRSAIVIGAGIAGLFSAYSLAVRGVQVTLFDKDHPLAGASGNPRAFFSPKLSAIEYADSHLPTVSFLYAHHQYKRLNTASAVPLFEPTGVLDFMLPTQKSAGKLAKLVASYPNCLIYATDHLQALGDCPTPFHACVPMAGLINPHLVCQYILSHPNITVKKAKISRLGGNHQISAWGGQTVLATADTAVICAGFESHLIHSGVYNCRKIRGQVSWVTKNTQATAKPQPDSQTIAFDFYRTFYHNAIKYDGYVCTADDTLLFGASFVRNDSQTDIRPSEHAFNVEKLTKALPACADMIKNAPLSGRASIRSQTPDYHPIVGRLCNNIYACTAMGSKGFSFAPLCGEIVAGLIFDEPLPVSGELLSKLSPHRKRLKDPIDQTS